MSNQQPHQPGWSNPQQPQGQPPYGQPPYGQPPYGQPPFPPQPPKKTSAGKIIGLGCLGIVGLVVVIGIAAAATSGSSSNTTSDSTVTSTAKNDNSPAAANGDSKKTEPKKTAAAKTAVFKVWGTAPAGALGSLDIGYGSDTDTRQGAFKNGKFEATLPLKDGTMYYQLNAQLQGSGDINCSVTVDGKTKTGHASGGYNICTAQLSSDFTGGWQ
ncbi:hypothetical protein ABZ357_09640 [Streptomyces sp. NPDC005917]|uniref:hypothetical protein n=1 Tax=unclassified Streptomyces TaxID=2593676 RepID=UPI0033E6BA4D